jgi:adenylate cyclase
VDEFGPHELETLDTIARVLNSTLEFDEVLRLVMDRVIEFVNAERGFLVLIDPKTSKLEFIIARDKQARTLDFSAFRLSQSFVMRVIQTRQTVLADDAQSDFGLRSEQSIIAYSIRTIMCAPLIVRNNCIGAVYVDSRINANLFGEKHRGLLLAFCNQAAIALDNARLFSQVVLEKEYLDNIINSLICGVIMLDSSRMITLCNKTAGLILHLKPEEITGRRYQEILKERPQISFIESLYNGSALNDHRANVSSSVICEIPGHGQITLNITVTSLHNTQGVSIGRLIVIDDQIAINSLKDGQ